jgi:hypothetical protein
MLRTTLYRITAFSALCMAANVLTAPSPSLAQETESRWVSAQDPSGATEVSARSEIAAPKGAGFATLKILHRTDGKPAVIVYLIVESPKRLSSFPFDKYDGPVDKTDREFIQFEVGNTKQGSTSSVKVMPNGYYGVNPPGAFVFDTIDKSVVSFLSRIRDGQRMTVRVNGPPDSVRIVFDTTGLRTLLDQMNLKAGGVQLRK